LSAPSASGAFTLTPTFPSAAVKGTVKKSSPRVVRIPFAYKGGSKNLGPRYAKRNGGYLRILKTGFRKGDNTPLALVSLMDRIEQEAEDKPEEKKTKSEEKKAAKAA
jgi:hypothetical protein